MGWGVGLARLGGRIDGWMGGFCIFVFAFWEYAGVLRPCVFQWRKDGLVFTATFFEAGVEVSGLCLMISWYISDGLGKWFSF